MVNPVAPAVNAFLAIWTYLPLPIKAVFYVGLILAFVYALYMILSR